MLGISISNIKIQLTEIIKKQNQIFLSNLDEVYLNEEINFESDKETKITSLLHAAFEELSIKNQITSNNVSFSLPQELFISARLPIEHSLLHSDLTEEFRWQLSIMYPYLNWHDYVIQYSETEERGVKTQEHALVFALNRKFIKLLSSFCEKSNLKLKFVDHCHLAASNMLILNAVGVTKEKLSFYVSQKIFSLLISSHDKPIYYEDIPVKSVNEIPSMIREKLTELNKIRFNFNEVFLFGDSASHTIAKVLAETVGIDFILVNPFANIIVNTNLMTNKYYSETNHFFCSSTGVSVRV